MNRLHELGRQIWRFRPYWRPHLPTLGLGISLRAGELLADIAKPWPLALVIDEVLQRHRWHGPLAGLMHRIAPDKVQLLTGAALALLLLTLVSGVLDYLGDRLMNSAGESITAAIRQRVFAHLLRLPMRFHDRSAVGELTNRVSTDANRIENSLVALFSRLLPGVLSIAGFAAVMLIADWRLGLIGISCAPVVLYTSMRYTVLTKEAARQRRAAEGSLSGQVAETLGGVRTIHALGSYACHEKRFSNCNQATLEAGLRAVELRARFTPMLELSTGIGLAMLLWLGGYGALRGWWTAGLLVVVLSYLRDMLKPMRALSRMSITLAQGAASAERINEILKVSPQDPPSTPTHLPERSQGHIEIRDVAFHYGREPVLCGVDASVQPGERIALLGSNGSGKSTLIALIAGLYAPDRGTITLDGTPLDTAPRQWLHRQIALVLQDTFLFSGTIADNIALARPRASRAEIECAAERALVTEFTARLPRGLDTELSDHGGGLSGGQRQRIGIARAFLADAPVVLLDEPTTGLDQGAEDLVIDALQHLVTGRSVLMTTHRPGLLRLATRVLHMRDGELQQAVGDSEGDSNPRATTPRIAFEQA